MIQIVQDNWLLLLIGQYPYGPLGGLAMTLIIAVTSLLLCIPVSIALALAMTSGKPCLVRPARALVQLMRGMPFLMLIFWAYFALPLLIGHEISPVTTLIGTLVVYKSAYIAEIVRGGIESLPKGQIEAAHALGLNYISRTFSIVLPQVVMNMLPSIVTQFVGIVKDTSVGYIIGANELAFAGNQLNATLFTQPFEVFLIIAIVYFAMNYLLSSFASYIEGRIQKARSNSPALGQQGAAA
jgi:polar amino acid transport system permease protein